MITQVHSQDSAASIHINTDHIVAVVPHHDAHNPESIEVRVHMLGGFSVVIWVGDREPGETYNPCELFWFVAECGEVGNAA